MVDIAFWIFIATLLAGSIIIIVMIYNEMYRPYGKYKTFAEYYNATYAEMHRKDKK